MNQGGAERDGIVLGLLLDGRGGAAEIGWGDVARLPTSHPGLWLQLDRASPRAMAWVDEHYPGLTALEDDARRPRVDVIDNRALRLALRAWLPTLRPGASDEAITSSWLEPSCAIALSHGALAELPELRSLLDRGLGPKTIPELAIAQLEVVARRFADAVAELDPDMAELEYEALRNPTVSEDLRVIGLKITRLRRHVAPARMILDRLLVAGPPWLLEAFETRLRRAAEDLRAAERELHELFERADLARDHVASHQAGRMNQILYVLTIVSTIMMPLTFVTGVFGMNVGIPGASIPVFDRPGSLLAVGVMLIGVAVLEYLLFARRLLSAQRDPHRRP